MPKSKTKVQRAAGKLISAIQKEWENDLGETYAEISENVMDAAHNLLQAGSAEKMNDLLGSRTLKQFLGEVWVQKHPKVKPAVDALESILKQSDGSIL